MILLVSEDLLLTVTFGFIARISLEKEEMFENVTMNWLLTNLRAKIKFYKLLWF